jgi:hypothetical protein
MQVAVVKASISLRTKKRGNVPPRFETLSYISEWKHKEGWVTYVARRVM